MKKIKFLTIPVLGALLFSGCAKAPVETNKAPSVTGVKDIQCIVNSTVDFLDGVAALDKEDGDITPKMEITVTPEVEVSEDGYAYFSEVGEYTVNYSVEDSEGRTAQKRAFVDVVDRETYKTYTMPEGFTAEADGAAKIDKCGMINSKFVLEATGGEIAEDIKLTRTYALTTDKQYTFRYTVNSDVAGKIKVLADGYDCAEYPVIAGDNVITFSHTARKVKDEEQMDVRIDVCLGALGNVKWTVKSVETDYPQEEGQLVERAEDFKFAGKVSPRIESTARGNAYATIDNGACLEIDETCTDIWLGGMFVNTEINFKVGVTYTVSFDVESVKDNSFEVILQNKQWGEKKYHTFNINPEAEAEKRRLTRDVTVTEENAGTLWIYVQSGTAVNKITVSDLSVKEHLGAIGTDDFKIEDFTEYHNKDFNSVLTTDRGNFTYTIESFSASDGDHQVTSPSFLVAGSCKNYVITFKAKASAPIEMTFISPVYGGWDPTLVWSRFNFTEEEQVYTFFCYGDVSDRLYTLVWQFGSASNQKYNDVKIEISDIKISLRNNELDG